MENDQKIKLGAGIWTISILHFIGIAFSIIGTIMSLLFKDAINEQMMALGEGAVPQVSQMEIIIGLVFTILMLVSVILILRRKAVGVYCYFGTIILRVIFSLITVESKLGILFILILPVLMAIFIYIKKEVYGFGTASAE